MQNDAYWRKRAAKRMYSYQQGADKAADTVAKAYAAASAHINNEMASIFRAFRENIGMTEQEARELLKQLPSEKARRKLKELAKQIRDPEKRKKLESLLSAPAYAYRLRRFEELQADIDRQMSSLGAFEKKVTTEHYVDLANEAYLHSLFDLQKGTGLGFSFARMSASRVHEILAHNWSGRQYSERIWGRSKAVNQAVQDELLVQFMTGRSYNQTAREIESRMGVGAMEARRLVRTESTYIANSAELESYRACGMEKFRFCAVLDIRTSDICAAMDGRVFEVEKASVGENVPPLHPWCRSTTVAHFEKTDLSRLERSARDPVTGKHSRIPGDMTYEDWKKQVDETHGGGTWETERKKVLNRAADRRQYDKYRETLGKKNLPKTLDGFQQLKYNNRQDRILSKEKTIDRAREFAASTDYENVRSFQEIRKITNKKLGYDGLPQIVNKEEFEKISRNKTVLYRGVHSNEGKSALEIVEEFKSGDLWTGNSGQAVFGNGVYFTATEDIAKLDYAGNDGKIIKMILKENAKIADYKTIFSEFFETGIPNMIGMPNEDYQVIIRDVGQYAALK